MNLDLESGITAAKQGRRVTLASRCSVHCKSDATHKLNKGECTSADIACSLIASLADRIATLVVSTGWPQRHILLAGGLAQSTQLVEELSRLLPETRLEVLPESGYLEAVGAAVAARQAGAHPLPGPDAWVTNYTATYFYLKILEPGNAPPELEDLRLAGHNFTFFIGTVDGQSYTVQQNTNLDTTNWIFYTNITGDGTLYPIVTPVTNYPQIFFRVREP